MLSNNHDPKLERDIDESIEKLYAMVKKHEFLLSVGNFIQFLIRNSILKDSEWPNREVMLKSCIEILTISDVKNKKLRIKASEQPKDRNKNLLESNPNIYQLDLNNVTVHHEFNQKLINTINLLIKSGTPYSFELHKKLLQYAIRYHAHELFTTILCRIYNDSGIDGIKGLHIQYFNVTNMIDERRFFNEHHSIHRVMHSLKRVVELNDHNYFIELLNTLKQILKVDNSYSKFVYKSLSIKQKAQCSTLYLCLNKMKKDNPISFKVPKPVVNQIILKYIYQGSSPYKLLINYFANIHSPVKYKSIDKNEEVPSVGMRKSKVNLSYDFNK